MQRKVCAREVYPLSGDCGGDCWGCVGKIEADLGCELSLTIVRQEFDAGLRPHWTLDGKPKSQQ